MQFTDQSTGNITDWEWDFDDDGVIDSFEQNPKHYYNRNSSYSVTLIISGPGCEYTLTKDKYIEVSGCKT